MPNNIPGRLILLSALGLLVASCQSKEYDDTWAQCQASAVEGLEKEDPQTDQRTSDLEDSIRACMEEKGFKVW